MGRVGPSSARFIAEDVSGSRGYGLRVWSWESPQQEPVLVAQTGVDLSNRPRAIELTGLKASTGHFACLWRLDGKAPRTPSMVLKYTQHDACMHFDTLPEPGKFGDKVHRVFALSCDRWNDDGDDGMWASFVAREGLGWQWRDKSYSFAVGAQEHANTASTTFLHMGDQVYMDDVVREILADGKAWSLGRMMGRYREYYRMSWTRASMRLALRTGSHLFLPDDHDVFNNFAGTFRGDQGLQLAAGKIPRLPIGHEAAGVNQLGDIITAAHAAYMEYQYQTGADIPSSGAGAATRTLRIHVPDLSDTVLANATLPVPVEASTASGAELDAALLGAVQAAHVATMQQTRLDQHAPMTSHGAVPLEGSQSLQVARTGFLLVDTRLHRGTAYHADDHLHNIVSASSLARVWTMLRDMERSADISEIVVVSSIPLFWMDETMAWLAHTYENDKYMSATTELPGAIALYEVLAASTKIHTSVGGDVHVLARVRACRTNLMEHLRAQQASQAVGSTSVMAEALAILSKTMRLVSEQAASVKLLQASASWQELELPEHDPAVVLREALSGRPVDEEWQRLDRQPRCLAQLVSSGVTVQSASLASPVIAYYNGALRWLSSFRQDHWSANITDLMQANNYLRMDISESNSGSEDMWASRTLLNPAASTHIRWGPDDTTTPVRCSSTGEGMLGSDAVRLLDVPHREPTDWLEYVEPGSTLRFLLQVRAAQVVMPSALAHTSDEGLICECGGVASSGIVVTACRRALRPAQWVWQQTMTDSGLILAEAFGALLAGLVFYLGCMRCVVGCCWYVEQARPRLHRD